ncbi:MAG: peroxiredoxin [Rickettsiales bacterium]|jgi:peroxiredoxin (alkyl hydroperoxide reductase subunit C)|nr:peroxiredoxin [Rickettsiales bacterium]
MHDFFDYQCREETAVSMPLIGDLAPEFTAETTNGPVNFPDDYKGKWVILFSHPSDFTPVCTSEFMTFQSMLEEFRAMNTEIIGLSIGSLTSHIAWMREIQNKIEFRSWSNLEIQFPVIDDTKMTVAKKYGMLHPNASDTKTVRAVFIIDPSGIVRTILYYPQSAGRNFTEIKRLVAALQTSDVFGVSTPADWLPGEDVIIGAPRTAAGAKERLASKDKSLTVKDWFMTFKKLSAQEVFDKIFVKPKALAAPKKPAKKPAAKKKK